MTLAAQMKVDAGAVFLNLLEFGESVSYQVTAPPPAPPLKGIIALVDPSFDVETGSLVDTRQSVVILADATDGIAAPKAGDTMVIRGRFCRVEDVILSTPDGLHELQVEVKPP